MGLFSEIFSWWGGNTWGTRFTIARQGRKVGEDDLGNTYYEQVKGTSPHDGPRRWVIYSKSSEASLVPPAWHSWLHHTVDVPPTDEDQVRTWQKPHKPNMTGTSEAYRPPGSILTPESRPRVTGDYTPWTPD